METLMPSINLAVIAPMLTVFVWASALLLVDLFFIPQDNKRLTAYLALGGLALAALVALPLWGTATSSFTSGPDNPHGMVVLDNYALTLTWILLLVGGIAIAIALDYLPRQGIEQGEFYTLILFAVGGMLLLVQGTDLIVLFLAIELLSITLYVLTAFAYPRLSSEEAAMKYLILGAFAAGFFVYGIALIFGATGTLNLFDIGMYLNNHPGADHTLILIGTGLVLVAFGFKIALVPFHMWTPDVYEGAPTPVAAFMSVGTKGAALAALLRILELALPTLQSHWLPVLGILAALTMIVGNVGAIIQTNVKRMLAYSSIGHAGYILLGIMAVSEHGTEGFLFYLLAYALTNMGAFAVVIALEQRGEAAWNLDDFAGLWKRQGALAVAMAVFMLSLAGVPPTAGFVAKFYVFTAAWESGLGWLALIGVITSAIAAFFYLRVIVRMFMYEPVRDTPPFLYRGISIGIGMAFAGTILFGIMPSLIVSLAHSSLLALGG